MRMRIFVALAAFLGFVPLAHAAPIDTYEVTSPGPLDSFNIRIRIESADHVPVLAAQWRYDFPAALDELLQEERFRLYRCSEVDDQLILQVHVPGLIPEVEADPL